ncbi:MAG: beta-glucosidase, partial [Propionibacteriaceae bacterium]|nr:beta-glucosidase [Propionibacteriaceae bacterium]
MTDRNAPWHDPALPVEARVDALLAELILAELVGQLHQPANVDVERDAALLAAGGIGSTLHASGATAGNVSDEGVSRTQVDRVQRAAMGSSRLGIPLLIARDVIHGHRTVAPIPLALGATFDEQLVHDLAARAALEAAADGITWTFAPMLDLVDDPRWGRVAESFGESPLLTARLGGAAVRGFQTSGRVAACAKHYAGYGLSRGGRDYARVDVGEIALRNRHLVPFRAAVRAGVGTVMAAFCDVDGIPMHSHRHLLREVLKGEWGFDGVVVADWNGIGELVEHGVAVDLRDAARQAIEAGVDVDMVSGAYAAHLAELVESGVVERALVEDAARRVLRLKVRLGLLD